MKPENDFIRTSNPNEVCATQLGVQPSSYSNSVISITNGNKNTQIRNPLPDTPSIFYILNDGRLRSKSSYVCVREELEKLWTSYKRRTFGLGRGEGLFRGFSAVEPPPFWVRSARHRRHPCRILRAPTNRRQTPMKWSLVSRRALGRPRRRMRALSRPARF